MATLTWGLVLHQRGEKQIASGPPVKKERPLVRDGGGALGGVGPSRPEALPVYVHFLKPKW